jgi:hypothetical protein
MKISTTLLFILFFCCSTALANDKYNWPELLNVTTPDSLKGEDAIYLDNRKTIDFHQMNETSIVHFKRIRLLSKQGVKNFSEHELYQFNSGHITMKKARVIKSSGEMIELSNQHIFETSAKEKIKYGTTYLRRIQFVFPNLEIGDVIDIVYQIDYDHYLLSNTLYLEDELVSLNSRLTLRNMSAFELSIYPTQNMSDFISNRDDDVPTFYWNKTSVRKQPEGFFFAHAPNSSKVAYTLWYEHKTLTYEEIYAMDLESYSTGKSIGGITGLLVGDGIISGVGEPMSELVRVIRYLQQFDRIPESEVSTAIKTVDYFKRSVISESLYFRYLQLYLEDTKLPYRIGFTKSLLNGPFQHGYVSFDQLDERFLVVYDEDNNAHFIFGQGSGGRFYHIDEIPFYCEGNESIVLKGDKINLSEAMPMSLPVSDATNNKHTGNILLKVDPATLSEIGAKRSDLFSGHYSYLLRGSQRQEWLRDFAVSDTLLIPSDSATVYPYELTFKQDTTFREMISSIDDSLYWFKPELLLPEGIFYESETEKAIAEYGILPFLKQDKISIYLECTQPVTLAETTKKLSFSNDIGYLKVEVIQTNATTLKFVYEIRLNQRLLMTKQHNEAMHQLLVDWNSARSKKWAIRF